MAYSGYPQQVPASYAGQNTSVRAGLGYGPGASPPGQMDTSGYLPGYLLGGSPQTRPPVHQQTASIFGQTHPIQRASLAQPSTVTPSLLLSSERKPVGSLSRMKPGGPPVQSLHDQVTSPVQPSTPAIIGSSPERRQLSFSGLRTTNRLAFATPTVPQSLGTPMTSTEPEGIWGRPGPTSPAQMDPFYTQGDVLTTDDSYDEQWVTVFGFPPGAATYILEQFSQYGDIVSHEMVAEGNWMHLQYHTRMQAKQALSKNGKVFGDGVMVGVRPCIDKAVMKKHATMPLPYTLTPTQGKKAGSMRPLTAAYQASSSAYEVVPTNPNTPQKSTGFISRTLEYMFGW